jgi:hypothetical protein
MNKDIKTLNSKGQIHGYYVRYLNNRLIRCNYKFDSIHEYRENHLMKRTLFYIK